MDPRIFQRVEGASVLPRPHGIFAITIPQHLLRWWPSSPQRYASTAGIEYIFAAAIGQLE